MRCASPPRARANGRASRVANTAIGAVSFLALEAIGGSITVNYGFVNATSAILVVGALIFLDRPADRLLRRDLWRRHRPAHARRRLRLHRIDDHVADLRLVHLPVLRHRSRDHVAGAGDVLRRSAVRRLRAELPDRHSAGDARHHLHQPPAAVDAADLDRPAPHARSPSSRSPTSRSFERWTGFPGTARRGRQSFNLHPVRHRRRPSCSR